MDQQKCYHSMFHPHQFRSGKCGTLCPNNSRIPKDCWSLILPFPQGLHWVQLDYHCYRFKYDWISYYRQKFRGWHYPQRSVPSKASLRFRESYRPLPNRISPWYLQNKEINNLVQYKVSPNSGLVILTSTDPRITMDADARGVSPLSSAIVSNKYSPPVDHWEY